MGEVREFLRTFSLRVHVSLRVLQRWRCCREIFQFLDMWLVDTAGRAETNDPATKRWYRKYCTKDVFRNRIFAEKRWSFLGHEVQISVEWKLNRRTEDSRRQTLVSGRNILKLNAEQKNNLLDVFLNNSNRFIVKSLTPKFLKVGTFTTATPVEVLTQGEN